MTLTNHEVAVVFNRQVPGTLPRLLRQDDEAMRFVTSLAQVFALKKEVAVTTHFVRHLLAGGIGTLVYVASVTVLVELSNLDPVRSVIISFALAVLYTYIVNRVWVYRSTGNHGHAVPKFLVVVFISLVLNTSVMYTAVDVLHLSYIWGLVATVLLLPPTNFLLNFYWAFK